MMLPICPPATLAPLRPLLRAIRQIRINPPSKEVQTFWDFPILPPLSSV